VVRIPQIQSSAAPPLAADQDTRSPQQELKIGGDLTRHGSLQEAIPHLVEARKLGADPYATGVNLGICYLGTGRNKEAIAILELLRAGGSRTPTVDKLLAQAYVADGQLRAAYGAFTEASAANPKDESVYEFFADACTDHQQYAVGLHAVERGLQELPDSARLHYERAVFLARLGRLDEGKPEFDRATQLEPGGYIGYLALVQKELYDEDLAGAKETLRRAIKAGHRDYQMLSLLGTVLLHEGAAPGQPEFAEAEAALEESAKDRPDYSATQIALGKVYLMQGQFQDAVDHLERARNLEPDNPTVYSNLASAYSRLGDRARARQMEAQVARLLAEKKSSSIP
jgi:predicted Zn-dependent protease